MLPPLALMRCRVCHLVCTDDESAVPGNAVFPNLPETRILPSGWPSTDSVWIVQIKARNSDLREYVASMPNVESRSPGVAHRRKS
jgi:hypothetical protein